MPHPERAGKALHHCGARSHLGARELQDDPFGSARVTLRQVDRARHRVLGQGRYPTQPRVHRERLQLRRAPMALPNEKIPSGTLEIELAGLPPREPALAHSCCFAPAMQSGCRCFSQDLSCHSLAHHRPRAKETGARISTLQFECCYSRTNSEGVRLAAQPAAKEQKKRAGPEAHCSSCSTRLRLPRCGAGAGPGRQTRWKRSPAPRSSTRRRPLAERVSSRRRRAP